ncbi:MAG: hypothetical protein J6R44_03010 [Clostridia bacterium]|nr:hypothetical protein [Clostridia bacterium]
MKIITIDIPDYSTTIVAKKSMSISTGDVIQAPIGYAIKFYYKNTEDEIPLSINDSGEIIYMEENASQSENKKWTWKYGASKQDAIWYVDVVCYKDSSFSFDMPWGIKGKHGRVRWEVKNPAEMVKALSNPTNWSNDGALYYSTYAKKTENVIDGLGVRLREVFLKSFPDGQIDDEKKIKAIEAQFGANIIEQ